MTEQEWRTTEDPIELLRFLRTGSWWRRFLPHRLDRRRADPRRLRLLACGYERMHTPLTSRYDGQRFVLATAERYADGGATVEELRERAHDPDALRLGGCEDEWIPTLRWWERNWSVGPLLHADWASRRVRLCGLLRCIFNPFRPVTVSPAWLTPTVLSLAEAIYADRAFDRLPILADALEDAGCDQGDILGHCRQPGEHVRGCWVVDLVMGRG